MPKVYIANQGVHDFTPAEKYGELIFVTKGIISKFAVSNMARFWAEALKDSKAEDFIISGSLNTLSSIGCSLFARKHGRLNLLLFRNGKYMARTIMLDQLLFDQHIESPAICTQCELNPEVCNGKVTDDGNCTKFRTPLYAG